jgi:hypothetical protein
VKLQSVIDRALQDPIYAAELAAKAGLASRGGGSLQAQGEEWRDLLAEFADGPEELGRLMASDQTTTKGEFFPTGTTTTTTTTITTTTSLPCGITTTTTTTTVTTTLTTTF